MEYVGLPPIQITYDPDMSHCAMSDSDIMKHVEWVAQITRGEYPYEETVSQELVIMAYRLLVKRGTIPHTNICVLFKHLNSDTVEELRIDHAGNLNNYPLGFCTSHDAILGELINW